MYYVLCAVCAALVAGDGPWQAAADERGCTPPLGPTSHAPACLPLPPPLQALVRRSKAYEQMGQHKAALADMQKANRLDAATADTRVRCWRRRVGGRWGGVGDSAWCAAAFASAAAAAMGSRESHTPPAAAAPANTPQEAERRLRDLVAGKKPAGLAGGLAARGGGNKASAVPTKAPASGRQVVFPAKLSMGDDTRILQVRGLWGWERGGLRRVGSACTVLCLPEEPSSGPAPGALANEHTPRPCTHHNRPFLHPSIHPTTRSWCRGSPTWS